MLDIRFVRESPDVVRADLRKRNDLEKLAWVDDLLAKDLAAFNKLVHDSNVPAVTVKK